METKAIDIGSKIKQLRKEKGWTQDQFAEISNIDSKQISKYENNRFVPSIDILIKLAKAFDISIEYLVLDGVPKASFDKKHNMEIIKKIEEMDELPDDEKKAILLFIDALNAKRKLKQLANSV